MSLCIQLHLGLLQYELKKKLQQALHYIMLCPRRSVVVEDGVNESRGSVVSHPETNFNPQFVGHLFPHVIEHEPALRMCSIYPRNQSPSC